MYSLFVFVYGYGVLLDELFSGQCLDNMQERQTTTA